MLIWVAIALLLGFVVLVLLSALRPRAAAAGGEADTEFYRAQLDEIERQVALGQIAAEEADAARAEAARRLLAATKAEAVAPVAADSPRRIAAALLLLGVPLVALSVYWRIGAPELPAQPLSARLVAPTKDIDLAAAVQRIEEHLAANPDDARGYQVIAPVYMRMGRYADAARSFENALRLSKETSALRADLGEAYVAEGNGIVVAAARAAFERAVALDPGNLKARFYLAQAAEQDGDKTKAIGILQAMRADAREPAAVARINAELERLGAAAVAAAPKSPAGEAIASLSADERGRAIRTMVAGLDQRLADQGGNPDEWARLVRAYTVLNETDKARDALERARKALAATGPDLARFDDLVADLGIARKVEP